MAKSIIRLDTREQEPAEPLQENCGIVCRRSPIDRTKYLLTNRGPRAARLKGSEKVLEVGATMTVDAPKGKALKLVFECGPRFGSSLMNASPTKPQASRGQRDSRIFPRKVSQILPQV